MKNPPDSRPLTDEELNTVVGGVALTHWQGFNLLPSSPDPASSLKVGALISVNPT